MDEIIGGITLLGIPLVVAIPVIISAFRSWGLSERWTGPVAAGLGIICVGLVQAVQFYPLVEPWAAVPFLGLLVGLASNGAFSQFRMWKNKLFGPPAPSIDDINDLESRRLAFVQGIEARDELLDQRLFVIDELKAYTTADVFNQIIKASQDPELRAKIIAARDAE